MRNATLLLAAATIAGCTAISTTSAPLSFTFTETHQGDGALLLQLETKNIGSDVVVVVEDQFTLSALKIGSAQRVRVGPYSYFGPNYEKPFDLKPGRTADLNFIFETTELRPPYQLVWSNTTRVDVPLN
jgi:hypothetical protein